LGNLRAQINQDLVKNAQTLKISENYKILSFYYTTDFHYHHEIGFFRRFKTAGSF